MGKKHLGRCALCKQACELTFEHIPPAAAFNSTPAKPVSGDKIIEDDDRMPWDTTGLKYYNQQRGMGKYSLCKSCNNNTGTWYGYEYIKLAHIIHSAFGDKDISLKGGIGIKDVYPLRFIKQVLSMFCAINSLTDKRFDSLREFVLNKNSKGIDKTKYKLCMYFTKSNLVKYAPLTVILRINKNGTNESIALTEITAYPLGFILYLDPTDTWEYDGFDITSFADIEYDDIASVEMPLLINEVNDIFPTFYRTKEEIIECIEENKKWAKEHLEE